MNNVKFFYVAVISMLSVATQLNATVFGGVHSTVGCIGNCTGDVNNQGLNAIGDVRSIDTSKVRFKNLGKITTTRMIDINTPTAGQQSGYEVVFTAGDLANKSIQFLGMYETEAGQVVYKFYRKVSGDKLWTEVGTLSIDQAVYSVSGVIAVDGALVFSRSNSNLAVMYLGTKNLVVPVAAKAKL